MPKKLNVIPESHIVLKLATKEKFAKYNKAKAEKAEDTHNAKPEIGDVRRYYEKEQKRYITVAIIRAKGVPVTLENLKLMLWNLHCKMEALQATVVHLEMSTINLKPLDDMDLLLALEEQFQSSQIAVHVWYPPQNL